MKANELMIGDWVEPRQCMIPTVYCKIEGIYPDGTVHLDKAEMLFTLDELTPVPLTPEILEKNGFERTLRDVFVYDNEDISLIITFTSVAYHFIDIERGCTTITGMPIEFVHQLQHALRLCGIEKTIKL